MTDQPSHAAEPSPPGEAKRGDAMLDGAALSARLPVARGRIAAMRPLADLCWLRVGGPAEALFQPADRDDLAGFLAALPADIPLTPLGVGSNLIIRDGGLSGVAVRLGRGFNGVEVLPDHRLRVGAALLDSRAAMAAAEAGIAGLEFLRTIPGALGGAVRMNAGCYGAYAADVVETVTYLGRDGRSVTVPGGEIGFGYRSSDLPEDAVIVEAVLRGRPGDPAEIEAKMADYIARREASQPTRDRSCGSTFRNPSGYSSTGEAGDPMDLKAWTLIDAAGCRGLRRGGAVMSEKHSNFLVNAGGATAADLEGLGEEVRARVRAACGIALEWEIRRIGLPPREAAS
ncbi:UDP-N-acetylmuramate dehydrogenase [Albimonas donghaensis]|uniref:UDP-N-acetylenolpyruvoylglucosamine reductase n=2 Tax=Albimonas donghaensis TaxID=356660 RepID=A0A1H3EJ80_9RHOB|nr:UDP-N-acetylmuramate dehydrogenase [Albimonas donghaensis]